MSCLLIGAASAAHADPIVVANGALYYDSDFGCCAALLDINGSPVTFENFVQTSPIPGAGGALLPPGSTVAFNVSVTSFDEVFTGTQVDGTLQFLAAPLLLPSASVAGRIQLTTPFTMTGNINARTLAGAPVFSGSVGGSGSADVFLRFTQSVNGSGFFLDDAAFAVSTPAATPEPATLLLIAGGLGAYAGRKRARCAR